MKWVEIITLRSLSNINTGFLNELLREEGKFSDPRKHPIKISIYRHSVVETDLSIHIHWKSEPGSQHKTPLGLKLSYALRSLGLLNHSVWIETAALEVPLSSGNSSPRAILAPDRKDNTVQTGPKIADKEEF
jgi:hypothetical protein